MYPIEQLVDRLDAQEHRRFIKTHSPAGTIPFSPSIRYITLYRHAPDALVSWGNHRRKMRPKIIDASNQVAAADGLEPLPLTFDGDYDVLFEEWASYGSSATHLASWWPLRDRPNALLLHYADLVADLTGEMQRIAEFLGLDIDDGAWPDVVARCRIAEMRATARAEGSYERGFEGGVDSFFHQGVHGGGQRELSDAQLDRVAAHCAEHLDSEALAWLKNGSSG